LQAKLLRFLQERTIERLGGRSARAVDVRIVCATHQDLTALIKEGRFREDLYYRVAEIVVDIPPLRQRKGDAVLLAHAFLKRAGQEQRTTLRLTDDALRAIDEHAWPGNVRELLNVIRRAAIMAEGERVGHEDLGLPLGAQEALREATFDLRRVRDAAERDVVTRVMARTDGNLAKAAELLGVSRPTLYDLIERLGIRAT
jgi:two-component system NtrC family response regulator